MIYYSVIVKLAAKSYLGWNCDVLRMVVAVYSSIAQSRYLQEMGRKEPEDEIYVA